MIRLGSHIVRHDGSQDSARRILAILYGRPRILLPRDPGVAQDETSAKNSAEDHAITNELGTMLAPHFEDKSSDTQVCSLSRCLMILLSYTLFVVVVYIVFSSLSFEFCFPKR